MLNFVMGGMSLASGFMKSKSAKRAAKSKAKAIRALGKRNADAKRMEAGSILDTMRAETTQAYAMRRTGLTGQKATTLKTGIALESGTSLNNMITSATQSEMSIQNARRNRILESDFAYQQADTIAYEAEINARKAIADGEIASQNAMMGGLMGAAGGFGAGFSALSAASKAGKTLSFGQKLLS